jgi:predicted DCC family thiol-disulfide oxidoreductase YuxK
MSKDSNDSVLLTVFYDGDCPICSREMWLLQRRPNAERIFFVDYRQQDLSSWSLTKVALDLEIHAINQAGVVLKGIDVFSELYRILGFRFIPNLLETPVLRPLFKLAYRIFAKNRLLIGKVFQAALFLPNQACKVSKIKACPAGPGCKPSSESNADPEADSK